MNNKLLDKFVKKDYNNRLEKILAEKNFSEEVKNSLLSMFYKIENGYEDYNTIKKDTFDKQEYIEKLIKIIEKDCEIIEFISTKDKEVVTEKEIHCYPIETKILYSLAKIQKRSIVVNYLDEDIEEAFSFILNTGNNMNIVEPLRDFNGFSWNVITKDIEDVTCNLIYQNILFLIGNKFVDKWVNNYEPLVDYFELFQNMIEKKYGKEAKEKIIHNLLKISILEYALKNNDFTERLNKKKDRLEEENRLFQNTEKYIIQITDEKKKKEKEIIKIDKILSNKELLEKEYERRNKKLPLEKKIFSIRTLKNIIKKEREEIVQEIRNCNKKILPEVFLEARESTKKRLEYIDISNIEDIKKEINKKIVDLQKDIIKCMYIDLKRANEKNEILNILYIFRYYNLLPITSKRCICNIRELNTSLNKLTRCILTKFLQMNIMVKIFNRDELNYKVMEMMVVSKIISFEKIDLMIYKNGNDFYLSIFDEEIEESRIKLENVTKDDINIKINKKIKLFKI